MEIEKLIFGSASTYDEKIEEIARIRQYLRKNQADEEILLRLQEFAADKDADVRCEVVYCLSFVEKKDLPRFAFLLDDYNTIVASKADEIINKSLKQKQEDTLRKMEEKSLRGMEFIRTHYGEEVARICIEAVENNYAEAVGHAAHDLCGAIYYLEGEKDTIFNTSVNEVPAQKRIRITRANNNYKDKVESIYRILDDMKTYARKTPEDRMSENLSVLFNASVDQAVKEFSVFVANADDVKVVTDIPDSLFVYVSSNVIQRAFSNLIKNAMESYLVNARKTKPGKVEVSAEKTQNGVRIVIRDYGVGLSKKALASARSFSPRTTSKKLTGSGFGLAIAYSKIKHHGGTLSIDSDGPDQGATVTIFLPSKGE